MDIQENVPLGPLTTFHIGGPARFFIRAKSADDIRAALSFARERSLPFLILGGGSNMLLDDAGFNGVVIKIEIAGVEQEDALLRAGAGEPWDELVAFAVRRGLFGIENLSGIPGSAGAAPVQNIGAYGAELKDTLHSVEAFDTESGEYKHFSRDECGFGYRTSIFKKNPGRFIVMRLTLGLSRSGAPNISYRDLRERFAGRPAPALKEVREAVLAIRARKFPDLSVEGTAGSFFLNPVVSQDAADSLAERFPGLPVFPAEGGMKISLAYVLDRGLNLKGLSHGGARLYEKQPLVIVARRGTSAEDVRALARAVSSRTREEAGLELEPEVQLVSSGTIL